MIFFYGWYFYNLAKTLDRGECSGQIIFERKHSFVDGNNCITHDDTDDHAAQEDRIYLYKIVYYQKQESTCKIPVKQLAWFVDKTRLSDINQHKQTTKAFNSVFKHI